MSCNVIAERKGGGGEDRRKKQFRYKVAVSKGKDDPGRSREMIEANSSCCSNKHRVLDRRVHAPPARGPQALDRRLKKKKKKKKSRITGETKRSTAGCTVNIGTFSSAALYSPRWDEMPDRERSEGLFVEKKKRRRKEEKKRERVMHSTGNWILMRFDIFFQKMHPKRFNYA